MVSGFMVSETGKPEKPGKNRKQKLHLTDASSCTLLIQLILGLQYDFFLLE